MNLRFYLELLKKYDFSFFGISAAIFIIGVFNLYSATHASTTSLSTAGLYKVQIVKFLIGVGLGFIVSLIRPKNFFRFSYLSYFVVCFLLALVLVLGQKGMGAQRWLIFGPFRIQPSEIAKLGAIFVFARWYARSKLDNEIGLKKLIMPSILALIPTALIVAEPDLGTGIMILLVFFSMTFYCGLKWKTIGIIAVIGLLCGGAMYEFGLKEYQKKRITAFLNPGKDARGSGYNAIQSKIAIGSGKFIGKGFMKSSQASLNYLPENHTDFVFSIFNEEHGFVGSLILLSLYLILLYRYLWLASAVPRVFDSIVVIGIMSLFFWHTLINMGMVMGLMPIVGLPLPFMSYGGSSLLTFCLCNGVATSISNSRNLF